MSIIKDIPDAQKRFKRTEREDKINREKKVDAGKKKAGSVSKKEQADKVQISSSAKSMMKSVSRLEDYQDYMEKIENLDKEQLMEVHRRIEEDYYDEPEVVNRIADALTESIPESAVDNVEDGSEISEATRVSSERLDEIRENIEEDKYDSDEVIDSIVERLLDPRFF